MRLSIGAPVRAGLLAAVLAGAAAGSANASPSPVVGHLYVNDNTAVSNTVAAFDRHANGELTAIGGSPFATGGAGTGTAVGSQGSLQLSADGHYLLAVDAGSNQVSTLRVTASGGLAPVPEGTVASGGVQPVSIAVHGQLVYVANAGAGGTDYSGFRLGRQGALRRLPGSTIRLPDGSQPGDVLFNSTGTTLVGTRVGTSLIDSFRVGSDGRLSPAAGSPYAAQGPGPFGSEFRPTNPSQLYVSNAHGGAGNGTVSAFDASHDSALTPIGSSPFADLQTAPCWVEISHDGRFLFTVNTAVPSISRYEIAGDGSLRLLGSTPFASPVELAPFDARLSPNGATLWIVDSQGPAVSGFGVTGGQLSELSTSPTLLPAGATPFGLVVN
jgi:6-phosphogluconolactonase (cycloisomerase 2 family)